MEPNLNTHPTGIFLNRLYSLRPSTQPLWLRRAGILLPGRSHSVSAGSRGSAIRSDLKKILWKVGELVEEAVKQLVGVLLSIAVKG